MFKFSKKEKGLELNRHYEKVIMPQIRHLWIDEELMRITGIKDLFAKRNEIKKDLSRTELEEAYLRATKMSYAPICAYNNNVAKKFFVENTDKLKNFEKPTLFHKIDNTCVIEFITDLFINRDMSIYNQETYKEKMKNMSDEMLLDAIKMTIEDLRNMEANFVNYLCYDFELRKLEICAEELSSLVR